MISYVCRKAKSTDSKYFHFKAQTWVRLPLVPEGAIAERYTAAKNVLCSGKSDQSRGLTDGSPGMAHKYPLCICNSKGRVAVPYTVRCRFEACQVHAKARTAMIRFHLRIQPDGLAVASPAKAGTL